MYHFLQFFNESRKTDRLHILLTFNIEFHKENFKWNKNQWVLMTMLSKIFPDIVTWRFFINS